MQMGKHYKQLTVRQRERLAELTASRSVIRNSASGEHNLSTIDFVASLITLIISKLKR